MNNRARQQLGGSGIVFLIILAIVGVGVFIGLQYVPQYIESGSVDSILSDLEKRHDEIPFKSTQEIKKRIERQLDVNDMSYLKDAIDVIQDGDEFVVTVEYERELNLLYEKKPMPYSKTLVLR
jgi:hypothetical protein